MHTYYIFVPEKITLQNPKDPDMHGLEVYWYPYLHPKVGDLLVHRLNRDYIYKIYTQEDLETYGNHSDLTVISEGLINLTGRECSWMPTELFELS